MIQWFQITTQCVVSPNFLCRCPNPLVLFSVLIKLLMQKISTATMWQWSMCWCFYFFAHSSYIIIRRINAKLGGVNAAPESRVLHELRQQPFIIMGNFELLVFIRKFSWLETGADVGHPAPGVNDQPSVASLVASYDRHAMKYNAYTTIQPPRLEPIDQLKYMVFVSMSLI